jgi:membrane protein DedA with SNARE-associated domain
MNLSSLVEHYGYAAVFVGALLEGESLLLVAGYAAHRGLLRLPEVMLAAFVASTLGDQLLFLLGRTQGERLIARFPSINRHTKRITDLVAHYPNAAIVSIRFAYGLRLAGPMTLGALGVPARKFVVLNMLSAALWAVLFASVGYQFGSAMQWLLDDLREIEEVLLVGVMGAAVAWAVWRWHKGRRA